MDARRVAGLLEIPFYVWDFSERFKEDVVDDFIAEYAAGRTPNPCLRCNETVSYTHLDVYKRQGSRRSCPGS